MLALYVTIHLSRFVTLVFVCVAGRRSEVDLPETGSPSKEAPGDRGGSPGAAAVPGPASRAAECLGHRPGRYHQATLQLPERWVYLKYRKYPKMEPFCCPVPPLDGSKV